MSYLGLFSGLTGARPSARDAAATRDAGLLASVREQWDTIRVRLVLTQSYLESPDHRAVQGGLGNTGIPACMDQLANVLLAEDEHSDNASLGMCMEYVLEQDCACTADSVFGGLLGLCLADEPRGVKRQMVLTFGRLVRGMQPAFLTHQGVIRVLTQLLHHCIRVDRSAGEDEADDALLDLICGIASQLTAHPSILRLFVEIGSMYAVGEDDAFPLFSYLLQHLHHPGERGFQVRTAALSLLRSMHANDSALLKYIVQSRLAESLSASAAAAYGLLPMHLDGVDHTFTAALDHERAARWYTIAKDWATVDFAPDLCTFMDLVWLVQEVMDLCAVHPHDQAHTIDQLEQLRVDILDHFRSTFLESVVRPSVMGCGINDGSAPAVLLYNALLFSILDPRGPLSLIACALQEERSLDNVITECITAKEVSLSTRIFAIRMAALYARRIQLRDITRGTKKQSPSSSSVKSVLAALAQSMQSPRHLYALPQRSLQHLTEVEQTMRKDVDYDYADRFSRTDRGIQMRLAVLQEPLDPDQHFLIPLLSHLCSFFVSPLEINLQLTNTLAELCRSPYVSLEGILFTDDPKSIPLLTFVLFRLVQQANLYSEQVSDFAFYLAQRKNQLLIPGKPASAMSADALVCPFATGTVRENMEALQKQFDGHWPIEGGHKPQLDVRSTSLGTSSPSNFTMDAALSGALHILVAVQPCYIPDLIPASNIVQSFPLLRVLDNIILLEEFLLELAATQQLREAWDLDRT